MSLHIQGMVLQRADGARLLGPLNLTVAPGDRVGLVGESGSGKSLLVQALFGVLPPGVEQSEGLVSLFGTPVGHHGFKGASGGVARLGWVPQDPRGALNPLLTLEEHLVLLPGVHRQERSAEALSRMAPLLAKLQLSTDQAFLGRFPHQISGGQRQRLCLAMALSCDPDLVILDEPTTALDPLVQREFLDLMLDLQRERNLGFLWITHDLAVASVVCERLLVIYGGDPMEAGPTHSLLGSPRHPYTARLLEAARHQPASEAGFLFAPQDRPQGCPFGPRCPFQQASCRSWGPWKSTTDLGPDGSIPDFGLRCEHPLSPLT